MNNFLDLKSGKRWDTKCGVECVVTQISGTAGISTTCVQLLKTLEKVGGFLMILEACVVAGVALTGLYSEISIKFCDSAGGKEEIHSLSIATTCDFNFNLKGRTNLTMHGLWSSQLYQWDIICENWSWVDSRVLFTFLMISKYLWLFQRNFFKKIYSFMIMFGKGRC